VRVKSVCVRACAPWQRSFGNSNVKFTHSHRACIVSMEIIISYVNNNLCTVIVRVPAGGGLHVSGFIVM
jgi:hypothetical protein